MKSDRWDIGSSLSFMSWDESPLPPGMLPIKVRTARGTGPAAVSVGLIAESDVENRKVLAITIRELRSKAMQFRRENQYSEDHSDFEST